jgi:hypothetical protein
LSDAKGLPPVLDLTLSHGEIPSPKKPLGIPMVSPSKNNAPQRLKTSRIMIRLLPEELEEIEERARVSGLTASEYIRRKVFNRPTVPRADLALVRELRRLGVLMGEILSRAPGPCDPQAREILQEISRAIERIARNDRQEDPKKAL